MADTFEQFLQQILHQPHRFVTRDPEAHECALQAAKELFQMVKGTSISNRVPLDELYTQGFDSEQIWEEIELLNHPVLRVADKALASFEVDSAPEMTGSESDDISCIDKELSDFEDAEYSDGEFSDENEQDVEEMESMDDIDRQMLDYDSDMKGDEEAAANAEDDEDEDEEFEEPLKSESAGRKKSSSAVDDQFFSMDEMDKFGDQSMDVIEGEEIDYSADPDLEFQDNNDGDGEGPEADMLTYRDFFEAPASSRTNNRQKRKVKFEAEIEDESSATEESDIADGDDADGVDVGPKDLFAAGDNAETDTANMTSHEKRMKRLEKSIQEIEKENLKGKDWQLMGEASSKARPLNSLLEEELEFEYAAKPVPVITEEITQTLDDLIKRRILEQSFNDVERRLAPADYESKRTRVEISDTKPEQSLAEVYEAEYQKQKSAEAGETTKQEPKKEHLEIDQLMTALFAKLDALTNWHFVPKPPQLELKVLSANDAPALEMEEIIPLTVSDAQKLAPQELYEEKKTALDLKTADELTREEKKKLRLAKKRQTKKEKRQMDRDRKAIVKTNPGLGNKHAAKNALKELSGNKNVTIIGAGKVPKQKADFATAESKSLKL